MLPSITYEAALGFWVQPFDAGALSTTRRLPSTSYAALRDRCAALRAAHCHRIEMLIMRVRVFWIEACVGYYTREVSSVPWTTPGRIYRPETRLPEQKLR